MSPAQALDAQNDRPAAQKNKRRDSLKTKQNDGKPGTKLTYKLQRELDALPSEIESLEASIEALRSQTEDADFYSQPYADVEKVLAELTHNESELEARMQRWLELEELRES